MFDHSISNYFWYKNTIISFVDLFRFKKRFFTYVFKFFKLKKFIRNKECNLMNYMISPVSLEHASIYKLRVTDLDQIFKKKDKVEIIL
ncbi:hypothetical protein ABXT43_00930 [Candidatus Pelagibacter sp. Uisw_114]